ncbi:MAG: hypothetical protein V4651_05245 [Bacteroidota bacterium]
MEQLPIYLSVAFVCITLFTLYLLYKASSSKTLLLVCFSWLLIQSAISLTSFYTNYLTLPPRLFVFLILPVLIAFVILFNTNKGKQWIDTLDIKWLTYLHIVRVPVELILFGLYAYAMIPELMTFEGRNFDILSGITAPIIGYLGYSKNLLQKKVLLIWNFICLALLINIVANALLAAPFPFQQFAFDQPNIAIFYFPFTLLPGFVVPAVLFSHLVSIRRLLK